MLQRIQNSSWLAYVALAIGVLCIGCSAIFVKVADLPGGSSAFYRLFFATLALLPWGLRPSVLQLSRRDLMLTGLGASCFAFDLVLWNSALLQTSAATATLLANNAPLWVGLTAWLIFREHLPWRYWVGLLLSLAGMSLIVGEEAWATLRLQGGNLLAIGASLFYAGYLVTTGQVRARVGTVPFMMLSVSIGALVLLVVCLLLGQPLTGFSGEQWTMLLGLGLISQLLGWLVINYALGHLPATAVSVTLLGQVLVTTLLAIPVLHELPTVLQIAGGALVLVGIYLVNQRKPAQGAVDLTTPLLGE